MMGGGNHVADKEDDPQYAAANTEQLENEAQLRVAFDRASWWSRGWSSPKTSEATPSVIQERCLFVEVL